MVVGETFNSLPTCLVLTPASLSTWRKFWRVIINILFSCNVIFSGHMLIRDFFHVLMSGTHAQSLSATFGYILYTHHDRNANPTNKTPILARDLMTWTNQGNKMKHVGLIAKTSSMKCSPWDKNFAQPPVMKLMVKYWKGSCTYLLIPRFVWKNILRTKQLSLRWLSNLALAARRRKESNCWPQMLSRIKKEENI